MGSIRSGLSIAKQQERGPCYFLPTRPSLHKTHHTRTNSPFILTQKIGLSIVQEELSAGDLLPGENELARLHNVSRTSIRAVLQTLAGKGLIEVRPKRSSIINEKKRWDWLDGTVLSWVAECSTDDSLLCHLLTVRLMLEAGKPETFARSYSDPVLA